MKRELYLKVTVDCENYDDVVDELILEDSGILDRVKDGVFIEPIDLSLFELKANRVEIIDENGRAYVNWRKTNKIRVSMQDDNRTLKIFIIL